MRTPGTHGIEWADMTQWLACFHILEARMRRPRSRGYRAIVAHWDALEAQPREFFTQAAPSALREVQELLRKGSGLAGTGRMRGRERLKNEVNNALAKLDGKVGPGRPKIVETREQLLERLWWIQP